LRSRSPLGQEEEMGRRKKQQQREVDEEEKQKKATQTRHLSKWNEADKKLVLFRRKRLEAGS